MGRAGLAEGGVCSGRYAFLNAVFLGPHPGDMMAWFSFHRSGFTKRFEIVHIDYDTQSRTVKDSGHWYSRVVRENGFPITDAATP